MSVARLEFDVTFEDALAFARERGVVLPETFYGELQGAARSRAFTVSTIESLEQMQLILDDLNAAIATGQTFAEWRKSAGDLVDTLTAAHREVVFRTAVQTAYSVGHTIRQREAAASRPFLMWDAINDNRTRETHAAMDNHIAPINDPIWRKWSPPAGFNCRCARISLTEAQARARGFPMAAPGVDPDPGFEYEKADAIAADSRLGQILHERAAQMPAVIREAVARARVSDIPRPEPRQRPKLKVIDTGTASAGFRAKVDAVLDALPDTVVAKLNEANVIVATGSRVTEVFPDLKGVHPRGWPSGTTWDSADGLFRHGTDRHFVNVSETYRPVGSRQFAPSPRVEGVLRHELGHAVDRAFGFVSRTPEFDAAYRADRRAIPADARRALGYYLQKGAAGPSEAFAEVFGELHGGGAGGSWQRMLERFPNVAAHIRKLIGQPDGKA